jgi:hypothetical protein
MNWNFSFPLFFTLIFLTFFWFSLCLESHVFHDWSFVICYRVAGSRCISWAFVQECMDGIVCMTIPQPRSWCSHSISLPHYEVSFSSPIVAWPRASNTPLGSVFSFLFSLFSLFLSFSFHFMSDAPSRLSSSCFCLTILIFK